ncbi:unnamed protein product [Rotaria magnacalcarata]|uniref:Uncharacterized protein n=1 Tax=Rotaria magnacalcarata TaxID=392030 RepID=A0A8S2R3X4_9BILA|nr:unnamed protein product [Rotaria magnacalcarata]
MLIIFVVKIYWYERTRMDPVKYFYEIIQLCEDENCSIFVLFDIDSIIFLSCPRVSVPAIFGLTSEQAYQIASHVESPFNVILFDLTREGSQIHDFIQDFGLDSLDVVEITAARETSFLD